MDESMRTLMRDPHHRWTAEEVAERNRQLEIDNAVAEATAEVLNRQEEEANPGREHTTHSANGGAVMHHHLDGTITQTDSDGTEWLVTSGMGIWYDGPDDYVGYHPE
ncbi:MAG TPA: hypothetical protein VHA05_01610 [Candidatus Saccharimonadales bacterium]|nr:hypothetical protein [Candidatus Saccharimonadales bacterium]